jgi:hypothetical protein
MKACGGVEVELHSFLTSKIAVNGNLYAPTALFVVPIKYDDGWAPQSQFAPLGKEKSCCLFLESNHDRSAVQAARHKCTHCSFIS